MRNSEAGKGRVGFVVTLAVFLAGIFVAVKVVPVHVDGYQFRDVLREEARYAAVHHNDKAVMQRILDAAASMDIPLDKKNLTIERSKINIVVTASYVKPVDLKFATYTYRFHEKQKAPLF